MKKMYETPSVEKVQFMYRDQVVVASGMNGSYICHVKHSFEGPDGACNEKKEWLSDHE